MTRITRTWGALAPEQRIATVAAVALLVTMFLPWYDLQSLDRKTGVINSHSISAFGDVSFVEAAVFLVAAGVVALMFARAERRDFHMPGSDGAVVMVAGCWTALLIFYRVFSRPAGHGYPVGIEWGFFLAFVAAGTLGYAGWRMRAASTPEAPLMRPRGSRRRAPGSEDVTVLAPSPDRPARAKPVAARPSQTPPPQTQPPQTPPEGARPVEHEVHPSDEATTVVERSERPPPSTTTSSPSRQSGPTSTPPAVSPRAPGSRGFTSRKRPRFPPSPSDQLSFEDAPVKPDEH
ncbi:MAG TPA: hypothetical protein VK701_06355 [Solirubrobacteraceae bacterium]|jgi:hypothetical protein|nr:hypothetical protein [Solirubrobacteraceae bacterium]